MSKRLVLGMLLALVAANATAVPVFFDHRGFCQENCESIDLVRGDVVTASFESTTAGLADLFISTGEISDYSFTFGNMSFDSSNSMLGSASLALHASGLYVQRGLLTLLDVNTNEVLATLEMFDRWTLATFGSAVNPMNAGGFSLRGPLPVPEPGMLALLALGILGASLALRRRT